MPLGHSQSLSSLSCLVPQALDGVPTEQLLQQTQVPQYAYTPNMGQTWVLEYLFHWHVVLLMS